MGKQMIFYSSPADDKMIAEVLDDSFTDLIIVPYRKEKEDFQRLSGSIGKEVLYLAEKESEAKITYKRFSRIDGSFREGLDLRKSPVLEFRPSRENQFGEIIDGRFYACTEDVDFSKKVSKFFRKFKKELRYIKKYKVYVSQNIDISTSILVGAKDVTELDCIRKDTLVNTRTHVQDCITTDSATTTQRWGSIRRLTR